MIPYKKTGAALWVMGAALAPLPLYAEDAAPNSPATDQPGALQEIVVTAQKRSQSIDTVGMAITAVTGAQLLNKGITDVSGLSKLDPSLVVSQSFYGTPVYTIRGVGYNDYAIAATPTVSIYSDEVPYPYLALTKAVSFDLERVEVLKGPQGTLFGQNATGGAINYIDAKPTSELAAGLGGFYNNWDAANFHGFLSGPLTSSLTGRLAFDINEGGAWQTSESRPDDHLGDKDQKRLRGILDYRPTDNLKVELKAVGWIDKSDTLAAQTIGLVPQNPGKYPNTPIADPALAGRSYASLVGLTPEPFPTSDTQAEWLANARPQVDEHFYQVSGRIEAQLTDQMLLTVLGSYQHYSQNDLTYNTGSLENQGSLISGGVAARYGEARLSGQAFDRQLDWLAGADYGYSSTHETQFTHVGTTPIYSLIQLPVLLGLSDQYLDPFHSVENVSSSDSKTRAAFGNLEYHLSPQLSVHAGARYTSSGTDNAAASYATDPAEVAGYNYLAIIKNIHATFTQGSILTILPDGTTGTVYDSLREHNASWRVGIDWKPVPGTLAYASVSKGYKSGTFPTLPASEYIQFNPVKQESVLAYEVGTKSRFAQNRIEVDGALFYYDYHDKQLYGSTPDPLGIFGDLTAIVNIPKSQEKGAELSLKYLPIDALTLTASATYLQTRVTGDYFGFNAYSTTPINYKGEEFPNTPKWSARAGGEYDWDVFSGKYQAYLGADLTYVGRSQGQFGDASAVAAGFPSLEIDAYTTLDLRAGLNSSDGHWRIQLFGQNVTNRYYWTQATHTYDTAVRFAGLPRTYGGSIEYKF